jgi:hypothetical protein
MLYGDKSLSDPQNEAQQPAKFRSLTSPDLRNSGDLVCHQYKVPAFLDKIVFALFAVTLVMGIMLVVMFAAKQDVKCSVQTPAECTITKYYAWVGRDSYWFEKKQTILISSIVKV